MTGPRYASPGAFRRALDDRLRAAGRPGDRDPFVFDVIQRSEVTGNAEGLRLTVTARLGASAYETFPVDLTTRLDFVGRIEILRKPLPVQIEDVAEPPPMRLYPLGDQIADKVAAMYEVHGGNPSGRYRDLVDLIVMTTHQEPDINDVADALRVQEIARRLTLPLKMVSPGPTWTTGYAKAARDAGIDIAYAALDRALVQVGRRLDPALARVAELRRQAP